MRIRSFVTTLMGVALAGGSVMIAKDYLDDTRNAAIASTPSEISQIVVARSDIEFGQPLGSHMLTTQPWPSGAVPLGAFTDINQAVSAMVGEERRVLTHIYAGEMILQSKLSQPGEKVTLVQKLGANTRAVAIKVDAVTAVGGFVTPGDFVDIVLTQSSGGMRAGTILQNIRVIGVDQQSGENTDQPVVARTVTVEVTPDQGQRLALAQSAGTLSLTLRSLNAVQDEVLDLVELGDLFIVEEPVTPEATVVRRAPTITVRRGTQAEEVSLR